jgi:uncharacterized protein YkwD
MSLKPLLVLAAAVVAVSTVSVAAARVAAPVEVPAHLERGSTATRIEGATPYADLDPNERAARDLVDQVNAFRRTRGLGALAPHPQITLAAERYAAELAARGVMSHVGADGSDLAQRLDAVGFHGPAGENLGRRFATTEALLDAWLASPGHEDNLVLPFDYIGVGIRVSAGGTPYAVLVIAADRYVTSG